MTVKEIIEGVIEKSGSRRFPYNETCDHLMIGDENMEVTGVVTTFMATVDVIKEAIKLGANFIITHEPTWFTVRMTRTGLQRIRYTFQRRKFFLITK